jgi:hypothetical protein
MIVAVRQELLSRNQQDDATGEIKFMKINPDFVAPCGLYCGVCAIYIAHRDNNQKFKERLLNIKHN